MKTKWPCWPSKMTYDSWRRKSRREHTKRTKKPPPKPPNLRRQPRRRKIRSRHTGRGIRPATRTNFPGPPPKRIHTLHSQPSPVRLPLRRHLATQRLHPPDGNIVIPFPPRSRRTREKLFPHENILIAHMREASPRKRPMHVTQRSPT